MRVLLKSANKKIFRALLSIASAALLIRIMGMLNQIVVTARFGEGAAMDAYFVAAVLPLMIAQLLGSTIEASVIPVYTRVRTRGTAEQKSVLFSTVLNLVLITTVVLTIVMFLFRNQMIFVSAPALDTFRVSIASNLTLIIYPVLALMTIIGFLESILNAEGQFGWPSYTGLVVPLATGVLVLFFGKSQGVAILCIGMIVGLCLQLMAFILRTRRLHIAYRPTIHLRNPDIQLILMAAWPAFLGATISQASPFIDQIFASFLSTGNISALNYALKLISVPTGVIFMSAGRAALPYLSQQAAIRDMKAFRGTFHLYSWMVGLGTLVLSILMLFLAHPIIQLLFQHGAFTAADTNRTTWTIIGFVVGLVPMSFNFIAARAFSALRKNRVLVLISIYNVVANVILDGIFAHFWQSEGIALATSAVYFGAMFILYFLLCRTVGNIAILSMPPEIKTFLKKFDRLGIILLRTCIVIGVFTAGIMGIIINDIYTLRISLGSVVMLVFLRYRMALLITWMVLDAFIGSSLTFFGGNNIDTALTVPTILLLTVVPVTVAFKRFPALGMFSLFLVWVFASIGISQIGVGKFLTAWTLYVDCLAVSILAIQLLTTRRRVMLLIDSILLVAQFVALYGIYSYFTHQNGVFDPTTYLFRTFSIFGASPTLALYLSVVIPLMIFRTVTLRGFMRLVGLMGIVVLFTCLIFTLSRSAFICVPLSILLMVFFLPSRKLKAALFGGMIALALATVLLATIGNLPIFDRFFNQDILTLNNRTYLWQALLDHFDPTQLLGNGLGASNLLLNNLQVGYRGVIAVTPHNLFLETLYDHGIIGLSLLLLVFIALGVNLFKGLRKADGEHRILYAASLAVLVSVFIQGFESNDLWIQSINLYFWIIMALPFVSYWPTARGGPTCWGEVEEQDTSMEDTFPHVETPQAQQGRQFRQPVEQLHHV
jgi:putative peptidoglycan lipid II flippase